MADSTWAWLQSFYRSFCDGEWEHTNGCRIESLNNPGWVFEFDTFGTPLANTKFKTVTKNSINDPDGWIDLRRQDTMIQGACGPEDLTELVQHFRDWAEANLERIADIEGDRVT
ncbi:hypothetical protein B5C34_03425 [Pacificimonas flava]|uniref:Rhodanese-related sulfurtransferase n=2 Tax=Pacificimonas TaxID=1960290 RepID=A0A219B2K0_9SPHN|nr:MULTISPECIES: Imm53 family immunity protein [Pacificimonas]MBZ6377730.1 hypothetical protein [Pacificimonas aurantium]OWV32592.1 hypothetical protein B5C34_03425 [Pacificimonas flava]